MREVSVFLMIIVGFMGAMFLIGRLEGLVTMRHAAVAQGHATWHIDEDALATFTWRDCPTCRRSVDEKP